MPPRSRFLCVLAVLLVPRLAFAEPCAGPEATEPEAEGLETCARAEELEEIEVVEARAASAPRAERRALLEEAALRYDVSFTARCAKESSAPETCQRIADASTRLWVELGHTGRAIASQRRFAANAPIADRGHALIRLGDLYLGIGAFDHAAELYERGAESGTDPRTESAWVEAATLKAALGDAEGARATFGRFARMVGRRAPGRFVDLGIHVAMGELALDAPARARATLLSLGRAIEAAPLDSRVRARVLLARSSPRPSGHLASALSEIEVENPDALVERLREDWPDEPEEAVRLRAQWTIDALTEARLLSADEARSARLRELRAPNADANLETWAADTLANTDRFIADHYAKLTAQRPMASRRWIALAASRAAFLWTDLIEQLRSPAISVEAAKRPAVATTIETLARFILRERATVAFLTCHAIGGTIAWTVGNDRRAPRDCVGALRATQRRSVHPSDEPMFSLFEVGSSPATPLEIHHAP